VVDKNEQELREIIRKAAEQLPVKLMLGPNDATIQKWLKAEEESPPEKATLGSLEKGDLIYGVNGEAFCRNIPHAEAMKKILAAKKEVGEPVKLMICRPDALFIHDARVYREDFFADAEFHMGTSEIGMNLDSGARRVASVVKGGQASSQNIAKGYVVTKVGGVNVASEGLYDNGIVALVGEKSKELHAGALAMEFYTAAPEPKLLVEKVASAATKQRHGPTSALFGHSKSMKVQMLQYGTIEHMSGDGKVASKVHYGGLRLYRMSKDAKGPFVTLPFKDGCEFGCLSDDGSVAVLGSERSIIAYIGRYEAAAGDEENIVAIATCAEVEEEEEEEVGKRGPGTGITAGPPTAATKSAQVGVAEREKWTLRKMVMPTTGRLIALWQVDASKEGEEAKKWKWVFARYEIEGNVETNRYTRCSISEAGWYLVPESDIGKYFEYGGDNLSLLVSANVVSRDATTGLPENTGEVVAVAVAHDEGEENWKLVARDWPCLQAEGTVPKPVGGVEYTTHPKSSWARSTTHWAMSSTTARGGVVLAVGDKFANAVRVYDLKARVQIGVFRFEDWLKAVWVSDDGAYVVAGGDDNKLSVFGVSAQRVLRTFAAPDGVKTLLVSRDCSVMLTGDTLFLQGGSISPIEFDTSAKLSTVRAASKCSAIAASVPTNSSFRLRSIAFGEDGSVFGVNTVDKAVYTGRPGGSRWAKLNMQLQAAGTKRSLSVDAVAVGAGCVFVCGSGGKVYKKELLGGSIDGAWVQLSDEIAADGDGPAKKVSMRIIAADPNGSCVYGKVGFALYRHGGGAKDKWVKGPNGPQITGLAVGADCIFVYGPSGKVYKKELLGGSIDGVWVQLSDEIAADGDGPAEKVSIISIAAGPNGSCVYGRVKNSDKLYRHGGGAEGRWAKIADSVGGVFAVSPRGLHTAFADFWPHEVFRLDGERWMPVGMLLTSHCTVYDASTKTSIDLGEMLGGKAQVKQVVLSDDGGKHVAAVCIEPFDPSATEAQAGTPFSAWCIGHIVLKNGENKKVDIKPAQVDVLLCDGGLHRALLNVRIARSSVRYVFEGRLDDKTGKLAGKVYAKKGLADRCDPKEADGSCSLQCDGPVVYRASVYKTNAKEDAVWTGIVSPHQHLRLHSEPLQLATICKDMAVLHDLQSPSADARCRKEWDTAEQGSYQDVCWRGEGAAVLLNQTVEQFGRVEYGRVFRLLEIGGTKGGAVLSTTAEGEAHITSFSCSSRGEFLVVVERDKIFTNDVGYDSNVRVYKMGDSTPLATFRHVAPTATCVSDDCLVAVRSTVLQDGGDNTVLAKKGAHVFVHDARANATVWVFKATQAFASFSLEPNCDGESVLVMKDQPNDISRVSIYPVGAVVAKGATPASVKDAVLELMLSDASKKLLLLQLEKNQALVSSFAASCNFASADLLNTILRCDLPQQLKREILCKLLRVNSAADEDESAQSASSGTATAGKEVLFELCSTVQSQAEPKKLTNRLVRSAAELRRGLSQRKSTSNQSNGDENLQHSGRLQSPLAHAIRTRQGGCVKALLQAAAKTAPIDGRSDIAQNLAALINEYPLLAERFLRSLDLTPTAEHVMGHELPNDRRIPFAKVGLVGSDACAPSEGNLWHLEHVLPLWSYVLRHCTHTNAFSLYLVKKKDAEGKEGRKRQRGFGKLLNCAKTNGGKEEGEKKKKNGEERGGGNEEEEEKEKEGKEQKENEAGSSESKKPSAFVRVCGWWKKGKQQREGDADLHKLLIHMHNEEEEEEEEVEDKERERLWWVCMRPLLGIEETPLNEEEVTPYVVDLEGFGGSKIIGALARSTQLELFETDAVAHLIQWKWDSFGAKVHTFLVTVYMMFIVSFCWWSNLVLNNESSHTPEAERWAYATTAFASFFLLLELAQMCHQGIMHFKDALNWLDMGAACLPLYLTRYWFAGEEHEALRAMFTLASCVVCLRVLTYLRSLEETGSFIGLVLMVMKDMGPFLVILGIVLVAFAGAFYHLGAFKDSDDPTAGGALFGAYMMMFGELYLEDQSEWWTRGEGRGLASPLGKAVQSVFLLFVLVIMLNLLIAIISDTFEKVTEKEVAQFRSERARLIVEYEANVRLFSAITRIPLDAYLKSEALWLHVLKRSEQAHDVMEWEGRMRNLKKHMDTQHKKVTTGATEQYKKIDSKIDSKIGALESKMESKIGALESGQSKMESKLDTIIRLLNSSK
jgi:hypothetical protein